MNDLSRRSVLLGLSSFGALGLAGCNSAAPPPVAQAPRNGKRVEASLQDALENEVDFSGLYGAIPGEKFSVPAIKRSDLGGAFLRRAVDYSSNEPAGTIIVDPKGHYLYHLQGNGRATRYGVGVGRDGFRWSGTAEVHNKQEWPDWYPPKEMIDRQPEIKQVVTKLGGGMGMPGGARNPLGARALYLWQGNHDTLFRIHGTVEPWTIGTNVSSGCIRMVNQDVIDLYNRAAVGSKVIVLA